MNPREQLFAILAGQILEKPPVWLLFPYHATSYYVDVRNHPEYRAIHELSLGKAVILNRRNLNAPLFAEGATNPVAGRKLASEEDLEAFVAGEFETDPVRIAAELERQMEVYLAEKAEFPAEYGSMMLDLGEPIGVLYHLSNLEEFSIWSMTARDTVQAFLDRMMQRYRSIYRYCLERDLADVYFMVGSELAAPPLVGMEAFNEWVVPYAKELISLVHSYGKKVIQHFHGQIRDLLPGFVEMGPDALHTIESPPVGNCTMTEAFEKVGGKIALIGNIQYDEFRAMTPQQMQQAVGDLRSECRGKRLILSPTAGPFDPAPSARLLENYQAFLAAAGA